MKRFNLSTAVILLSLLCACESYYQEEDVICLPVNMSATIIQGTETKKLTADFTYIPGTDLLDHITWSNHQSHFLNYDETGSLHSVINLKRDASVQEEMWFVYNGSLVKRIDLVKRNLDPIYLDPVDSSFLGYIEFEYQGNHVVSESRYEITQEGMPEEFTWKVEYAYDQKGNILSCTAFDPRSESLESVDMTYDTSKHPFSGLQYYFNGESFVNNLLSKTLVEEGFNYNYEVELNEYGYPETIHEKLGVTHTRTTSYSYFIP